MQQTRLPSLIAGAATLVLIAVVLLSDTLGGLWVPAAGGSVVVWFVALVGARWLDGPDGANGALDERFSSLLEQTPDSVIGVDGKSKIVVVNERAEEAFGYPREEMLGKSVELVLPALFATGQLGKRTVYMDRPDRRRMGSGLELEARRKDGSEFPVELASSPFETPVGRGVLLFARDITSRREAEQAIWQSEGRLRTILENALDAVIEMDAQGIVTRWNQRAEEMFGWGRAEVIGNPLAEFIIPERHREMHIRGLRRFLDTGETSILNQRLELTALRRHGLEFPVELTIAAIPSGDSYTFNAFVIDISERKRMAEERERTQALERASKMKGEFLASMSHEIRTPMNAVLGFAQLLQRDTTLSRTQKDHVATILNSGEHLLGLINDILEMSKIEAGRATLQLTNFDMHRLLSDVKDMFRARANADTVQLEVERSDDVPRFARTDERKLRQVLINLLGNAVKFTHEGGIVLRVHVEAGEAESRLLVAEVQDTGHGISADELGDVFEPFGQTTAGAGKASGTGLGMPISRKYARLLGGDLTVTSEVGVGSVFRLSIEIQEADGPDRRDDDQAPRVLRVKPEHSLRVLVVDDKPENCSLLMILLTDAGFEVRDASDGAEAVEVFEEWEPQIVLMDMRMPVMDGYEATRRIKASPHGATTKVIAITVSVLEQDVERLAEAGVDDFMSKPFKTHELFEKIAALSSVEYVYDDEADSDATTTSTEDLEPSRDEDVGKLTSAALAALPASLLTAMQDAALSADLIRLGELIDDVARTDATIAGQLLKLAEAYEYERLAALLMDEA